MYIQLNSQIICYEKTGEGSPVILIHGNSSDHHEFDVLAATMSQNYTVYAMDTRGHGESATPKEYHYKDMAADVIELIRALHIEKPVLVGFSDGGIIALLVAITHSDLLGGIVACGANLTPDGLNHHTIREMKKNYKKTGDPKIKLMLEEPDITKAELKYIAVPALVIAGAKDCVKGKETETIAKSIPDALLKILPGEDHCSYIENTDRLYNYTKDFIGKCFS